MILKAFTSILLAALSLAAGLFVAVLMIVTFPLFVLTTVSSLSFTSLRLGVSSLLRRRRGEERWIEVEQGIEVSEKKEDCGDGEPFLLKAQGSCGNERERKKSGTSLK